MFTMSNRNHRSLFAAALAVVTLLALAGSLALAAPPTGPHAVADRQGTTGAITDTTGVTDTTAATTTVGGASGHEQHHPAGAATAAGSSAMTDTAGAGAAAGSMSADSMMGMMGGMMSMMAEMQGMMGHDMMSSMPMSGTMPMTGTMPMMGSAAMSDCMMIGPMMSMMGSMMTMMGAMQTMHGMMAGHGMMGGVGMMGHGMMGTMGMGMMGSDTMTDTMPMTSTMPMSGSMMGHDMMGMMGMGMMGGAKMGPMMDQMMQMMGQMQSMATSCGQMGQTTDDQPFDLGFIDDMIHHHEGAVAMAQQALEQAEHPEIKQMAQAIIDGQQAEISQMQGWRSAWYADAAPSAGMGMDMGTMEVPAGDQPYDLRFIDAMIPHHEGAIAMAQAALTSAEHAEIKEMAQAIIDAQQAEISQLQEWRAAWYPDAM